MDAAKIGLSQKELELVSVADWILTKNAILQKVNQLLGSLQVKQQQYLKFHSVKFTGEVSNPMAIGYSPKISKGENYKGLPYLILDYPRIFDHRTIFAIRTMFWWGNFFSVTLHLSGIYKKEFIHNLSDLLPSLQKNNFFICVNNDEWQHHFNEDNYVQASKITVHEIDIINKKNFFKISKKISVSEWQNADEFIIISFREIMKLLQVNYPSGKKDLLSEFPKVDSGL